ncbi:MAG: amidohydrolase family protein [Deltaproteobacteria bacterium]|nr:amidohydrolase family protein [Candidatus Zymogenaceae bacterium]
MNRTFPIALVGANVIDGHLESAVSPNATILIEHSEESGIGGRNGVITAVDRRDQVKIPPRARVIDCSGTYIIPGLINAHVHTIGDGKPRSFSTSRQRRRLARFLRSFPGKIAATAMMKRNVRTALASGVTTIRAVGDPCLYDITVRTRIDAGKDRGPRILTAGPILCASGGHGGEVFGRVADSPWEFRKAVRLAIADDVDFIKITSTGGVTDAKRPGEAGRPHMTPEEIAAVCDEAHRAGLLVAAHAESAHGVMEALEAGVDTIEHGAELTDEHIELFLDNPNSLRGYSALIPTLTVVMNITEAAPEASGLSRVQYENAWRIREEVIAGFRKAYAAGVKIGVGTDAGSPLTPQYDTVKELFHFMAIAGMTHREVIHRATIDTARIIGVDDVTGSIRAGKSADLVVLDGDPTSDIRCLMQPRMVVVRGDVIEHPRYRPIGKIEKLRGGR